MLTCEVLWVRCDTGCKQHSGVYTIMKVKLRSVFTATLCFIGCEDCFISTTIYSLSFLHKMRWIVCMCVLFLSGVVPIAFTVLLGKMYLLLVLCTVPTLLCLHLTPAFSPCSYRESYTIAAQSYFIILAPLTHGLKFYCLYFASTCILSLNAGSTKNHEGNSGNSFKYALEELSLLVTQCEVKISWAFCIPLWTQNPRKNKLIPAKSRNFMIPEAIYYPQILLWLKGIVTSFGFSW